MVLQLHVWGPAFGLPSIDAECLAAIAYLCQTTSPADYQLIQSSPSAVPTQHLPALYDTSTNTWTSSYPLITTHLQTHPPPSFHHPSQSPASPSSSPAAAAADATAYTAYLTTHAAPLLALSLYVSSTNYAAATRPAYSRVLPLPLPWTEPPGVRAAHARRAAHLGLSGLDADADGVAAGGERNGRWEHGEVAGVPGEEGWVAVPGSVGVGGKMAGLKKTVGVGVGALLGPEEKRRIRLEAVAGEVLDVLGPVEWEGQALEVRCLAWAYLALMYYPDVPRRWLREVMVGRYAGLVEFVKRFWRDVFGGGDGDDGKKKELPWVEVRSVSGAVAVASRFVRGLMSEVPWIGEQWSWWWTARKKREVMAARGKPIESSGGELLFLAGAGLAVAAASAGVFFYRGLLPFGEAVQVWRKPVVTLSSFGAAGAILSGALHGGY